MDIVQEFSNMATGLVAAIRLMTGARRRSAEARLSRSIEALVAEHADYVTFIRSSLIMAQRPGRTTTRAIVGSSRPIDALADAR
jgi:hypothetical protein